MKQRLTAALGAAIAMQAFAADEAPAPPGNPDRYIVCGANADAAQVNALKRLPDGKVAFQISTWADTFHGVADPRRPRYSIEKQVLALAGRKCFCLHE